MCPLPRYHLRLLTPESDDLQRGVGILISTDGKIKANAAFEGLSEKEKSWLRVSFDHWCANREWIKKRYHGWTASEFEGKFRDCFVFKGGASSRKLRLYGFLCHPKRTNPRFELCVLVHPAYKEGNETYEPDLAKTKQIGLMPEAMRACQDCFRR
jgi:hypothetical protein